MDNVKTFFSAMKVRFYEKLCGEGVDSNANLPLPPKYASAERLPHFQTK